MAPAGRERANGRMGWSGAAQRGTRAVSTPRLTGTRWAPREMTASTAENASTVVPIRSRAALSPVTP